MNTPIYAVHCRVKSGGALNVLEGLVRKKYRHGQSVKALFTLYSDRETLEVQCDNGCISIPIITALPQWLNSLFVRADKKKPRLISYFVDYRNLMPIFPLLMRWLSKKLQHKLQFENANILISSYAVAKNIDIPDGIYREIYFHQPMHYIWTLYEEYVGHMSGRKQRLYRCITPKLRRRDSAIRNYDHILANSQSTKQQIEQLYFPGQHPHIDIIHPPVDEKLFGETVQTRPDNYFLYINRLTKMFKHLDKIIHLCNKYQIPLIIAGDGPDKEELLKLAGPTVTFVGRISDIETKISLMKQAKGVLNIAHESFGIVTAEALLLGVPIFGLAGGATPELVDQQSGVLTPSVEKHALDQAFQKFIQKEFDRQAIQDRARAHILPHQQFWKE